MKRASTQFLAFLIVVITVSALAAGYMTLRMAGDRRSQSNMATVNALVTEYAATVWADSGLTAVPR